MASHSFIYLGVDEDIDPKWLDPNTSKYKIGQTRQTCWARCKDADYRIYAAYDFPNWLSNSSLLFLESYVRACFCHVENVKPLRMDYFFYTGCNDIEIRDKQVEGLFKKFVQEGIEVLYHNIIKSTPVETKFYHGKVYPREY